MTRALVTQLVDALEAMETLFACHGKDSTALIWIDKSRAAITTAREYLATEPSGERAELIKKLRWASVVSGNETCGRAADMLEADADLRTQLARRTVERDMAISMIGDCIDEQQAKRVPMTEKQIDKIHANTARLAQRSTTFFIAFARALESHHKINAPK